mmetsp:Transcript_168137/g.540064  ORF Transcript_168137/g.540064 Transcript_168137/m.540064 type:complete len:250 (+) Transcript_168137:2107-2856(+)
MPMKTTRRICGFKACAACAWPAIAQAGRLAAGLTRPVSQNAQSNAQPACEETHTVAPCSVPSGSHGFLGLAMTTASARSLRGGPEGRASDTSKTRVPPPMSSASCRNTVKLHPNGTHDAFSCSRVTCRPADAVSAAASMLPPLPTTAAKPSAAPTVVGGARLGTAAEDHDRVCTNSGAKVGLKGCHLSVFSSLAPCSPQRGQSFAMPGPHLCGGNSAHFRNRAGLETPHMSCGGPDQARVQAGWHTRRA